MAALYLVESREARQKCYLKFASTKEHSADYDNKY